MSSWLGDISITKGADAHQRPRRTCSKLVRAQRGVGTPAQDDILAFVQRELADGRPVPTIRQMKDMLGWMKGSAVHDCLRRIVKRGAWPKGVPLPAGVRTGGERT
jgi:hypothetical protein